MKLDYPRTFLLGFGLLGVSLIWAIYNSYVPIFLAEDFGLGATLIGLIMTLDNIAALFLQPWVGALSDRTRTPIGRRMPYLLIFTPIAAVAFAFIPALKVFTLFIVAVVVMLLAMALYRTPAIALMPDIIPSPLRSKANGVINFMGGVGALLAFFIGAQLYKMDPKFPFWAGAAVVVIATLCVFLFIKEPKQYEGESVSEGEVGVLRNLGIILRDQDRSAILLLLAIFFWFFGFNAIETFFTSYGKYHLGIGEANASMLLGYFSLTFIIFAIPSGFIATRFGRRPTILTGIVLLSLMLLLGFFIPNVSFITAVLVIGGIAWSLININSLPMVVDIAPQDRLGTYTGLYYFFSMLAAVAGPIANGWVIDLTGRNYNVILIVAPVFMLLAGLCMLGVRRGEALPVQSPAAT